jgi:hypothetical protein
LVFPGACSPGPSPPESAPVAAPEPSAAPFFRDVSATVSVDFTYHNGEEADQFTILEQLGGGLAALDFDGDGRLDLLIAGGGSFTGPDSKHIAGCPCKLYRNVPAPAASPGFRFEDVTTRVGLDAIDFYTHGAAVGDFDNDGWPDLLVTGWGRLALFHNEPVDRHDPGKGRKFVDVTQRAGLQQGLWTTSAAWGDLDGDGFPDLYLCQYVDWSFEQNHPTDCSTDGGKTRDVCSPKRFTGLEHKLFRNRGDGTFEDVSKAAGLRVARTDAEYEQLDWLDARARDQLRRAVTESEARFGKGLGVLFIDVNGDGKPDIYVANDMVDKFLYVNRSRPGKLMFEEQALRAGAARDHRGLTNGSMGLDAADYNGSGRPSLFVTNYIGELQALYRNECQAENVCFYHASMGSGIATIGDRTSGWGTGFLDVDHHGWEDLFLTAGDAYRHNADASRAEKPILFRNQGGGQFKDIRALAGPYFETEHIGRGVVLADFANDGRIDIAISHLLAPVRILHNEADTSRNHWLGVELAGAGHRDVVGARIIVEAGGRTQTRFAKGGGSYLSSGDRRHVIGLGAADHIDRVSVVWPSGVEQQWQGLAIDRYWRLTEGQPQALPLYQDN